MKRALIGTIALILVGSCFAQSSHELRVATRFGVLTLDSKARLLFQGHLIKPIVQANSGIDAGKPFQIGDRDVILVTIIGGTACPYLYHFVTVNKSSVHITSEFGTCNEALLVERKGDCIVMTLHDYRGPFEPEEERRAAAKRTQVFVFRDGVVSKSTK